MDPLRLPWPRPRMARILPCLVGLAMSSSLLFVLLLAREDDFSNLRDTISSVFTLPPPASDMSLANASIAVDLGWYAPSSTDINNLTNVISSTTSGVYGFVYNSSQTPDDKYGSYNWCNMPHVRAKEYVVPSEEYELVYVELVKSSCPPLPHDLAGVTQFLQCVDPPPSQAHSLCVQFLSHRAVYLGL